MARKEEPALESPLVRYQTAFREWQETRNYSPRTILHRHFTITRFITWCADPARLHRDGSTVPAPSAASTPAHDNARQVLLDALHNEAEEDESEAEAGAVAAVKTRR